MSKIGAKPITIPEGVTVSLEPNKLTVKGKTATLVVPVLPYVKAEQKDKEIVLVATSTRKQARSNWGTMGAHIKNAIAGVVTGFTKTLEIQGIGFKAAMEGKTLVLSVGYSHPVKYQAPEGITIAVEKAFIKVSGADRQQVGQVAAEIRKIKKPEPYQGKGIRYQGEQVRRKEGKKVAGATAA